MVENVFAQNPVSRALNDAQETARSYMGPQPSDDPKSAFEDLARSSRVPVGILLAISEASGSDPAQGMTTAKNAAARLAPLIAAGKKPSAALLEALGPQGTEASAKIMERARALAGQYYPQPAAPAPEEKAPATDGGLGITDTVGGLVRGVGRGIGMAVHGLGEGIAGLENSMIRNPINDVAQLVTGKDALAPAPNRLARSANGWDNIAEMVTPLLSQQSQDAAAGSVPTGELMHPSTWSLGKDPSVRGYRPCA